MEETKYQGELFELDKPKVPQRKLDTVFPKTRFAVTLSLERIVFISIGVIMLMVALYALGVEKGKSSSRLVSPFQKTREVKKVQVAQVATVPPTTQPVSSQAKTSGSLGQVKTNIQAKNVAAPIQSQPAVVQPAEISYTVVAAAFSRQESASTEAEKLKADKFDSFTLQSGSYYLVCVGSFATKDSAQKILPKLRVRYKDAYIKLRQ